MENESLLSPCFLSTPLHITTCLTSVSALLIPSLALNFKLYGVNYSKCGQMTLSGNYEKQQHWINNTVIFFSYFLQNRLLFDTAHVKIIYDALKWLIRLSHESSSACSLQHRWFVCFKNHSIKALNFHHKSPIFPFFYFYSYTQVCIAD